MREETIELPPLSRDEFDMILRALGEFSIHANIKGMLKTPEKVAELLEKLETQSKRTS